MSDVPNGQPPSNVSESASSPSELGLTSKPTTADVEKPVPFNHPGVIALVAYLLFILVVCLWLLTTFLMALPPPDESNRNGNANTESNTNNSNPDNRNSNNGNSNINTSISTGNSSARDDISRFVAVAYLQQGSTGPNRIGNASNNNATPNSTSTLQTNPTPTVSPTRENDQENRIQGIPRTVKITLGIPLLSSRTYTLSGEAYLFLIVIASGALGVVARAIFSIFRHIGLGDFSFRWTWYYVLSPSGGVALSVIFYVVVRGGFYNPATVSGDLPLNPFSFAALGALAGLFSENAMLKLKKIAEVLFMPVEEKS